MEINIENQTLKEWFKYRILEFEVSHIQVVSADEQDKGKTFQIPLKDVTHLEEDEEGLCIWWTVENPLEGRKMVNSNHFIEFLIY